MGWQPETQPKGKPPVEKTKGAETMQRLIDADALHKALYTKQKWVVHRNGKHNEGFTSDQVHFAIDEQPTIDAEPVRHGKWIAHGDCGVTECSCCGWNIEECVGWNYCPNCGARMDKE